MSARMLLCTLILFPFVFCVENFDRTVNDGLIDTLTTGVKFAKDFLGSESVALKVAEFVVKAFQPRKPPRAPNGAYVDNSQEDKDKYYQSTEHGGGHSEQAQSESSLDPLRHIVRLFGLQPPQMSAVAVNALLFVAQMISTFLSGPQRPSRLHISGDPTDWILNKKSRTLQELITTAKNESLPDMIEGIISDQDSDEETSCVRLLICKIIPFVTKMQETVFGEDVADENTRGNDGKAKLYRGASIMYRHLPAAAAINARSNVCEKKYPKCDLNNNN